jgi:hypothetical protein
MRGFGTLKSKLEFVLGVLTEMEGVEELVSSVRASPSSTVGIG